MHRRIIGISALAISACFLAPGFAATIIAVGAGSTPATAEDLTGTFPTEIIGTLSGTNQNDVNMFKFNILQPFAFSAMTVPIIFGIPDTVLSLFNSAGVGVYLNDDISGSNTLSCLPAAVNNPCPTPRGGTGPLAAGVYYLAISRSANYPIDAMSNEIFNPSSSTDVVGPSVTNPVAGWDNGAFTSTDFDLINYDIVLTGTTAVPEPCTFILIGAGLAVGLLRRKRVRA